MTYLTSFSTFGWDAYAYVAQEPGNFEEAGIEVEIRPGSGTVDVLKLIASGQADSGAGDLATTNTVANEDLPVVAVGAVHQSSLSALTALESSGIRSPADLPGRQGTIDLLAGAGAIEAELTPDDLVDFDLAPAP